MKLNLTVKKIELTTYEWVRRYRKQHYQVNGVIVGVVERIEPKRYRWQVWHDKETVVGIFKTTRAAKRNVECEYEKLVEAAQP